MNDADADSPAGGPDQPHAPGSSPASSGPGGAPAGESEPAPVGDVSRNRALLGHLVGAVPVVGVLAAISLWLHAAEDDFAEPHAKEALNFQLTLAGAYLLLFVISWLSFGYLTPIVRPIMFLLWLASLGLIALAVRAVAAGRSHLYPIALRPLR